MRPYRQRFRGVGTQSNLQPAVVVLAGTGTALTCSPAGTRPESEGELYSFSCRSLLFTSAVAL